MVILSHCVLGCFVTQRWITGPLIFFRMSKQIGGGVSVASELGVREGITTIQAFLFLCVCLLAF